MVDKYGSAAETFSRGYEQFLAKDYVEAAARFTEAIDLFPLFETAYRFRAEAYQNLGMDQRATADLQSVISIARDRQREAERVLGSRVQRPQAPARRPLGAAPRGGLFQSPIILWTGIISLVMVVAGVGLMLFGGR